MKKTFIALSFAAILCSCSLEENMKLRNEYYYDNAIQCQTGINACYSMLRNQIGGHNYWFAMECPTDYLSYNSSQAYNAILNISPTRPGIASTLWLNGYMGVMRSNAMMNAIDKCLDNGGCSQEDALSMKAEAVTLRAFFYYILTSTFGDVPYYTCEVTESNMEQIAHLPRMSAFDTRDAIVDELLNYVMPKDQGGAEAFELKRSYDGVFEDRMNAPVALMLAAKMCLWNHRWEDAIAVLKVLEGIYGKYDDNPEAFGKDYPLTDVPFCRKFTKESIFEVCNTFDEYGTQLGGYIAVVTTPSKGANNIEDEDETYEISDIYGGIGIPELGSGARISTSARPTQYYYQSVLPYDSPDLRNGEYSAGSDVPRGGSGNLAWRWKGYDREDTERKAEDCTVRWFKSSSTAYGAPFNALSKPWLGNKFWCPGMYYTMDSNNPKLFRYADALLMMSEAYWNLGDYERATQYLNITRVRAGLEKLTPEGVNNNADALMEEIRLERAKELFGEFQRKYDLVRWGIWYERTVAYNDGLYIGDFIQPCHRYLPIPAEQITYSGGALDNNEYGE